MCLFCFKLPPGNWRLCTTVHPSPTPPGIAIPFLYNNRLLLLPMQPRTQIMNLTSWPSWHLEAGGQLIVFQHNSAMIIIFDNSVGWQGLAGWFLCIMWYPLELSWCWYNQDDLMYMIDTSAGVAGIAGDWLSLPSDGCSLLSSLVQVSLHGS